MGRHLAPCSLTGVTVDMLCRGQKILQETREASSCAPAETSTDFQEDKDPCRVPCPGDRGTATFSTSICSQGFVENMGDVLLHCIKDLALQHYKVFRRKSHYFFEMVLLSYAKGLGWKKEPEPWSSDQRIKELKSSTTCQTSCLSQEGAFVHSGE